MILPLMGWAEDTEQDNQVLDINLKYSVFYLFSYFKFK